MSGREVVRRSPAAPSCERAQGDREQTILRRSPVSFPATRAATEIRDGWHVALTYEGEDGHDGPLLVDLSHRRRWDYQDSGLATHRPMGLTVPERFGQVGVHDPFVVARMNRTQAAIWHLGEQMAPAFHRPRIGMATGRGGSAGSGLRTGRADGPQPSDGPDPSDRAAAAVGLTETTDGHCMLALVGAGARRAGCSEASAQRTEMAMGAHSKGSLVVGSAARGRPSDAAVPSVLERLTPLDLFDPARTAPFLTQGPVLHVPCQVVTFGSGLVVMTLARGYGETFATAVLEVGAIDGLRPGGEDAFARAFARVAGT